MGNKKEEAHNKEATCQHTWWIAVFWRAVYVLLENVLINTFTSNGRTKLSMLG